MHIVDFLVIGVYLILMVLIGLKCRNSSKNISDYIRMGNKSTWWLAGCSLFMASFSAATFTGIAGRAFVAGWSPMVTTLCTAFGFFIQAAFLTTILRRTRAITPLDAVRSRFGPVAEQVKVYVSTFSAFFYAGFFLLGFGTFASAVFGIPLWIVIIGMGFVVIFYSVSGGSWSVQITDSLQALILIPVTLGFAILCLIKIGGFSGILEGIEAAGLSADFAFVKPEGHTYITPVKVREGNFTLMYIAASVLGAITVSVNISTCHRYLSLRDEKSARNAALLAGSLTVFGCFIWFIPPIVGRLLYADDVLALDTISNPADAAYAITAMKILPPGMMGLIFVCMLAATMSSMDGFLTGTAGFIVRNLLQPISRRLGREDPHPLKLLKITKGVNLALGLWGIIMAFILNKVGGDAGMFQVMQTLLTLIGSPVALPFALSLFVRRIPLWGLFSGIGFGICTSIILFYFRSKGITMEWGYEVFLMTAVCIIPTLISTLFWKHTNPEFRERVDAFFIKIHTPIDANKEVGVSADKALLNTVGTYALTIASLILLLIFGCDNWPERLTVLGICGFLGSIGGIMLVKSRGAKAALAETTP